MSWLTALEHVAASNCRQFGGKAVSLARLSKLGYSVPSSFVISIEATSDILRLESLGGTLDLPSLPRVSTEAQAWISDLALPSGLFDEIAHKTQRWSRYAVRSSAVHEDGESRSWAGILESCVDIALDEVEGAIRRCLASLYSPASLSYAASQSLSPRDMAMAIILHEFVDGQACGVAFSIDPVNHFDNAVTIEACSAAATKVTDGSLIPDHYTVDKQTGRILELRKGEQKEYALSRVEVIEVARHIIRLEREFGHPVDVEWTIKDGVFVPLQSRSVTTAPPAGWPARQAPQSYRLWWHDSDAWWQCEAGLRSFETERDVAANQMTDVLYIREGGSSRCLISVDDVMRLTEIGLGLRSRTAFERVEAETDRCVQSAQETLRALDRLADAPLVPADICVQLKAIDDAFTRCVSLYRMCDPYVTDAVFDAAAKFIPADTLIDIVAPSEPRRAQEAEDWSVLTGREFDEALAWEHARKYPWLVPNLHSRDAILSSFRRKHRASQGHGERRTAVDRRREFDSGRLPDSAREMLSNLRGLADMRLRLKMAFTSFDFHFVDLYHAIFRITGVSARELHARYSVLDMINLVSHGTRPAAAPPAIGRFHRGALTFLDAKQVDAFWQGRTVSLDHGAGGANEIRGAVANHGQISGRVHILSCNDPDKANQIRERMHDGDVLVSEMIQLNVMDLVRRAGGLITDEGGMLSHAAILAREMDIPCIVGTQRATQQLRDGDHVTIDTRAGLVMRADPPAAPAAQHSA